MPRSSSLSVPECFTSADLSGSLRPLLRELPESSRYIHHQSLCTCLTSLWIINMIVSVPGEPVQPYDQLSDQFQFSSVDPVPLYRTQQLISWSELFQVRNHPAASPHDRVILADHLLVLWFVSLGYRLSFFPSLSPSFCRCMISCTTSNIHAW